MYDVLVVGAGAAGCVIASRLSADPACSVLLIEAGPASRPKESRIPAAFSQMFTTRFDWNLHTQPQAGLAGRRLYWPRGRMVGGSAAMNAQIYLRGQRRDYDGWAADGAAGWDYDSVLPWFHALEGADLRDTSLGRSGPLLITHPRDPRPLSHDFLTAAAQAGIPRVADINGADVTSGASLSPVTQRRGLRWDPADAYLQPARDRRNLTVRSDADVRRVLLRGGRAIGVELTTGNGTVEQLRSGEVVLAAGSIGSPVLLQRSGIGPSSWLRSAGVDPIHNLPAVGSHLQDHLTVVVARCTDVPGSLLDAQRPRHLLDLLLRRRGPLTSNVAEALALVPSRRGLPAPDLELLFGPVPYLDHGLTTPPGHGYSVAVVLLDPLSRGTVRLDPANPAGTPLIDPGYLLDEAGTDLRRLRSGVRRACAVLDQPAFERYAATMLEPAVALTSDAQVDAFVREQAETLYHPVGTCRIGTDPATSVVDPHLQVHGIDGLRVADASVMPRIIRGHTQAPTLMIAERAAAAIGSPTTTTACATTG